LGCLSLENYIKPQLYARHADSAAGCLSLENYIKPQLSFIAKAGFFSCLSLENYIKPQPSPQKTLFIGYFKGFFIVKTMIRANLEVILVSFFQGQGYIQYVNEQIC